MATLVLTTVGGIVGGPIGAAIGGLLGQAVDRDVLFKPKGREGPRLSDLSVQTSSYGSPIPLQFGTMRIAGSVIWSTDLIESKSKTGGSKGQPDTTSYSYSVSFAVLLSARAIRSVGRIWADGNLLRGAAGDFKTMTGFRLYSGDEAQTVDPLIASAEGAALTPAQRGCAYVVFEDFQLADYGNRIPSLTFEIEADGGAVAAGTIAAAIGAGAIVDGGVTLPITGFSAYGDDARGVLGTLATAAGAWFAPDGAVLRVLTDAAPAVTVGDDGAGTGHGGARRMRSIAAIETVPKTITIGYYDQARDYQTGLQRARRPGAGVAVQQLDMPAVLSGGEAKTIAEAALARTETARETRTVAIGWTALAIAPGDVITIAGEGGRWRVTGWSLESMVVTLTLVRLAAAPIPAQASSGRALTTPDQLAGTTIVHAFELPPLDDAILSSPRILIAAAGTAPGWRRAALLLSLDNGASWTGLGATAAPAVIGTILTVPGVAPAGMIDRTTSFEIELAHEGMSLASADDSALDGGANLALAGDELLQFGSAEQTGPTSWRVSRLLRGRRGTEAAIGRQQAGDRFVVIDTDTVTATSLPLSTIGSSARILAAGAGDLAGPSAVDVPVTGASVVPPSVAHLAMMAQPDGDALLSWVRRSRAGWRWIDGVDAPLAEEREAYRVVVTRADGTELVIETSNPSIVIAAADRTAGLSASVAQIGSNGMSPAALIDIPARKET